MRIQLIVSLLFLLSCAACGGGGGSSTEMNQETNSTSSSQEGVVSEDSGTESAETGEVAEAITMGASNSLLRTCGLEGGPLRIMPLGDSITELESGHSSYRFFLWQSLLSVPCNVDFVGSRRGVSTGQRDSAQVSPAQSDFDQDHEGHWDYTSGDILAGIDGWAAAARPDIVLLHIGTNDARRQEGAITVIARISEIIDKLRAINPRVAVIVAQIIPSRNDSFRFFNDAVPQLAADKDTPESRVLVANHSVGFNPSVDLYDAVHPSPSGEAKMADVWLNSILELVASS